MNDILRDPLLQPPLQGDERMEALARLIARLSFLPVETPIVDLFDVVDASALPVLGGQFHIRGDEGWNLAQTESARRALLKQAIELHRHKGTPWSVRHALETVLGCSTEVPEWFAYGGDAHFFRVLMDVTGAAFSEEMAIDSLRLIQEYKNVRSWLEYLRTHSTNPLPVTVALAVVTRNSRRTLIHFPASAATPLAEVVALGSVTRNVLRGYIHFAAQKSPNGRAVFGLGAVAASASRSRMFFPVPEVPAHDARIAAGVAGHSVARNGLHFPVEQPVPVMARQPLGTTGHSRVRAGLHFPALPAPRGKSRRALAPISFTRSYLCPTQ